MLGRQNGTVVTENSGPDSIGSHPTSLLCGPSKFRVTVRSRLPGLLGGWRSLRVSGTQWCRVGHCCYSGHCYWQPLMWAVGQREGETDAHGAGLGTWEDGAQMWGERWAQWFGA